MGAVIEFAIVANGCFVTAEMSLLSTEMSEDIMSMTIRFENMQSDLICCLKFSNTQEGRKDKSHHMRMRAQGNYWLKDSIRRGHATCDCTCRIVDKCVGEAK